MNQSCTGIPGSVYWHNFQSICAIIKSNLLFRNFHHIPANTFIPYIYTPADIEAILKASTELRIMQRVMNSAIMCMPTLIRILYATGIRINEALSLKDENINTEYQYLKVKDSKNGKERIIPISKSLADVCKQYRHYRNKLPLSKQASHFFITP